MAVIEIEVRGNDRSGGRAIDQVRVDVRRLDRQLDEAARTADDLGDELRQAGRQAADGLDDAAEAAQDLGESLEDANDQGGPLDDMLGGLTERGGRFGDMLAGLGPVGAAAAATVGAAFLGIGLAIKGAMSAATASMDRTNSLARSKAQLGLSEADAARFGKIAAKIYADNFGETLEEAGKAARDTAMFFTDMADPAFEGLAKKLSSVADMMESETKETARAIAQMMRTGLIDSADEGFDLVVAAVNRGVDANDDLLDTLNEYSIQFKKIGLDAGTVFGLIEQMMKAGARDADIAADAVKEFSIRSIDGSAEAGEAYKALGLDAKKMIQTFAAGGPAADKAFADIINRLKAIKDPAERSAAAVGLFGTQSEDLGDALFAMDLGTAKTAFDDVAGAADRATATMGGSGYNAVESYRRQWEMFKADVGDKLLPTFERIVGVLDDVGEALDPIMDNGLDELADLWGDNEEAIADFWELAEPILKALGGAAIGAVVFAVGHLINVISLIGKGWQATKDIFAAVTPFILRQLEMLLEGAASAFGWIPGIGPKLREARDNFKKFKDETNALLDGIRDKTVTITIDRKVRGPSLGGAYGFQGFAKGTMNAPPGWAVTGEEGPELVKFRGGEQVRTAADSAAMMAAWNGGGGTAGGYGGGGTLLLQIAPSAGAAADPFVAGALQAFRDGRLKLEAVQGGTRLRVIPV